MNYFIKIDDESHGPLTAEQVRLRLAEHGVKVSDLVRLDGHAEWVPLSSLQEFKHAAMPMLAEGNPMAVASLALGILSVFTLYPSVKMLLPLFWITSIPAIILGHLAVRKIGSTFHDVKGYRLAKAGLWLGYLMTLILPVAGSLLVPMFSKTAARGNQTIAISNCRQIITLLRMYSADHDGNYPDAVKPDVHTSNEVFRRLFVAGIADNEKIFGSPRSVFNPDGNIGSPPDFLEALKPGENHWAMTRKLNDSMDGTYPLVFENPTDANWPPQWSPNLIGTLEPGRTWSGGKIIIGMNDSSVSTQRLESDKGDRVGLKLGQDGKDLFSQNECTLEILNVAR